MHESESTQTGKFIVMSLRSYSICTFRRQLVVTMLPLLHALGL